MVLQNVYERCTEYVLCFKLTTLMSLKIRYRSADQIAYNRTALILQKGTCGLSKHAAPLISHLIFFSTLCVYLRLYLLMTLQF